MKFLDELLFGINQSTRWSFRNVEISPVTLLKGDSSTGTLIYCGNLFRRKKSNGVRLLHSERFKVTQL